MIDRFLEMKRSAEDMTEERILKTWEWVVGEEEDSILLVAVDSNIPSISRVVFPAVVSVFDFFKQILT